MALELKYNVFISYSSKDQEKAEKLLEYLEKNNLSCFLSKRNLIPGDNFNASLVDALTNSDSLLLLGTKSSFSSNYVFSEVEKAFSLNKRIIVVRIENCTIPKEYDLICRIFQWFEAIEYPYTSYFEQIVCVLNRTPLKPFPKSKIAYRKLVNNLSVIVSLTSIILFLIWGIPILKDYKFITKPNHNGVRLIDAIRTSGFIDIEPRSLNHLPPVHLFRQAKKEIFISAITAKATLETYKNDLQKCLDRGIKIRLMLLDIESKDSSVVSYINKRGQSFRLESQSILYTLKNDPHFSRNNNMKIKFIDQVPNFTGIMIDGSIDIYNNNKANRADTSCIVRYAPYLKSHIHDDWIISFKASDSLHSAADDFANEFKFQWNVIAKPNKYL